MSYRRRGEGEGEYRREEREGEGEYRREGRGEYEGERRRGGGGPGLVEEEREIRRAKGRRRERMREERVVELSTLGVVLLVFVLFTNSPTGVAILGGAAFTFSGIYQSSRRWRVNPLTWIGGIGMLLIGALGLQDATHISLLLPALIFGGIIFGTVATGEL